MKDYRSKKRKITDIGLNVILILLSVYRWIDTGYGSYNAYEYLRHLRQAENLTEQFLRDFASKNNSQGILTVFSNMESSSAAHLFMIILTLMCLSVAMVGINLLICLFRKQIVALDIVSMITMIIAMAMGPEFGLFITLKIMVYPAVCAAGALLCFVAERLMDSWDERKASLEASRNRERDRKRRLAFPGKYSKLYYQLMWKNYRSQMKDAVMLFISCVLTTSFVFAGMGLRDVFSTGYGKDMSMFGVGGLVKIIQDFMLILVIVSLVLLSLSYHYYWKEKIGNFGVLLTLGIRRESLYRMMRLEIFTCCVIAICIGILLGHGYVIGLTRYMANRFPELILTGGYQKLTYAITAILLAVINWFGYHIGQDAYHLQDTVDTRSMSLRREKLPKKSAIYMIGAGIFCVIVTIFGYSSRKSGENVYLLATMAIGLYLCFGGIWSKGLHKIHQNNPKYGVRLFQNHTVRYRFFTSLKYVVVLSMIHISVLFYFLIRIASNQVDMNPQANYPYDYVCLADDSEEKILETIAKECHATVTKMPMIRATAFENTENPLFIGDGSHSFFEGVNMGLSESSYRMLKENLGQKPKENLKLDKEGKQIFIVYQQDKGTRSQPIDWLTFELHPHIHIGTRVMGSMEEFPSRKIVGEEVLGLTGCFLQGKLENIVVFSDEFFDSMLALEGTKEKVTGPNRLWLFNVPKEDKKQADTLLNEFSKQHIFNDNSGEYEDTRIQCVYKKDEAIYQQQYARMLETFVNIFVSVILTVIGIFILHLKVQSETQEMKKRYLFMKRFGMYKKERIRLEVQEIARFVYLPFGLAALIVPILSIVVFTLRDYTITDFGLYLRAAVPYIAVYLIIQGINAAVLIYYAVRKIEGDHGK